MIKSIFKSKKIIAFFGILVVSLLALSTSAATWQTLTSDVTTALNDVYFVNTSIGWAVADGGKIIKTINGGTSWTNQTSGTTKDRMSVYFLDANTGWTVGDGDTILKTTNSGTTWALQISGTAENLEGVYFVDANTGWVVGTRGEIRKTTDGGTSWTKQTSGTNEGLNGIYFVDANTGWIAGDRGTILKTTNGGTSWTNQTSGTIKHQNKVYFIDANTGWTVGDGDTILKTTNGGTSWTVLTSGTQDRKGVYFVDANTGWTVGGAGTILKTTNGGTNWVVETSGTSNTLNGVFFSDINNGWAVGASGKILRYFIPTLSCSVTTSAGCSGAVIWRMSGATNAHAELPGQTTVTYDNNVVCCTGGVAGLGNSCSGTYATPLKLSGLTNAHVQKNNVGSYVNSACISVPFGNGVSVGYVTSPATCSGSGYNTTLGSMTAINNSHVGNADWTQGIIKICATVAVAPVVSISINDGIVTYGTVAAGASKTTIDLNDTQILTNTGNVTEMFNIKGQNTACPWTLASTAGINQYAHQFCKKTDVSCANPPTNYTALTSNYQTLYTNVVSTGSKQFDLRLTMPTASSCFTSQSVDVIIQAVQQ